MYFVQNFLIDGSLLIDIIDSDEIFENDTFLILTQYSELMQLSRKIGPNYSDIEQWYVGS